MCWPPFTDNVEPVMKPASSATRNSTVRAMSSALPSRPPGIRIAGRDGVYRDPARGAFFRQRFCKAVNAGFGGGVIDLAVLPGLAVDRADIDDSTKAAVAHALDDRPRHVEA